MSEYIEGAVVNGASAHALDKVLRSPSVSRILDGLPPWMRAEMDATRKAIHRAAVQYEALPYAADGTVEAQFAEATPGLHHEIDTREAAELLGLSTRRVRQLAAGGMGRQFAGRWLLDRSAVLAYGEQRRCA